MDKKLFKIASKKQPLAQLTQIKSSAKRYWERVFTNKWMIVAIVILVLLFVLLLVSKLFYSQSYNQSINDAYSINYELPSSLIPFKSITLPEGEELNVFTDLKQKYTNYIDISKINNQNYDSNSYLVLFNAYGILNDNSLHLLGTNASGIDIYARVIKVLFDSFIICFFSILFALLFSMIFAPISAIYLQKDLSKSIEKWISIFALLPYLLFALIINLTMKFSILNFIISYSILSSLFMYINAYQISCEILKNEYINVDKSLGFSKWNIFTKDLVKPVFFSQLIFAIEQISLMLISYSALAIFNIDNTNISLGLILNESLQLFDKNPSYLLTIFVYISLTIYALKTISYSLSSAYTNIRGQNV